MKTQSPLKPLMANLKKNKYLLKQARNSMKFVVKIEFLLWPKTPFQLLNGSK